MLIPSYTDHAGVTALKKTGAAKAAPAFFLS